MTEILNRVWNPTDRWPTHDRVEAIGLGGQHSSRAWEYALALHAIATWRRHTSSAWTITYDVGGAGSPFQYMLDDDGIIVVIDPATTPIEGVPKRLQDYVVAGASLADVVTCLSVLEHIPVNALADFCYCLSCLVAPGGLLVLTVDYQPDPTIVGDPMHWHWMREQIFNPVTVDDLIAEFGKHSLAPYGGIDTTWHGPLEQTDNSDWGYAPASIVLTKLAPGGRVTIV